MATEIKMPQLGESVTEGTIGKWLKRPGERVEKYEALLEVSTDKVDTEVPAPESGILREIAVPEGTTVRVGTLLAILENDADRTENPFDQAQGRRELRTRANGSESSELRTQNSELNTRTSLSQSYSGPISPVVARLASEYQLDIGKIEGTGQGGRITKQDVLKYLEMRKAQPAARADAKVADERAAEAPERPTREPAHQEATTSSPPTSTSTEPPTLAPALAATTIPTAFEIPDDAEIVPLTPMRRTIAEHMVRSRRTAPHVTSVFELDVSRIVAHRERRKAEFERQGVKLTYTAYFVQAAVAALEAVPSVNSSYSENGIVLNRRINIGVAVALEEGLIVPVLRDADEKNLLGLARGVNDLAERARTRRLKPDETHGGSFTITNHGVSGSLFATPIINQPQAAILGIGAIQKRAVVITQNDVDAIAIRPMCYVSLTIDHRLLDGATADKFLSVLKEFVEGYSD
jgi:2-oxoisovalerate dehydrogenase E2 component (dihydrolipoyl transacylase)